MAEKSRSPRVSLLLLGAAAFIVIADARVIDPLLHIIANEFEANVGTTAIIVSAYTIPYGLFQLVYGPLGDRIGKVKVMTGAMAAFAIGTAGCAFVPNIALLTLLRFLTGMVAAAIIPLSLAYIGDNFPYAERQAAIGRYLSALMLGQILGGSIGGIFGDYLSWRDIFLVFGVISLLIAAALWRANQRLDEPIKLQDRRGKSGFKPWGKSGFKPYLQLMKSPATRLIITAVFIEGFFLFGGFAYLGAFLRDRYNLPYIAIGFMLSGFGVGGLIYSASVKWLVSRLGEQGLIFTGGWLVCFGYLAIVMFQNWILFIPISVLIGMGFYMLHSTLQTRATELAPEARGTAVSLFVFSLFVGQGIGAIALGAIVDSAGGYIHCFITVSVSVALLTLWLYSQRQRLNAAGS
ncbi:MFS transporter [Aliterella atlantica]|uniref:MFS transporter n=1 Tax=Aliterella atlantica CENA595 TaxID=1618023 RepID=A0A0D8ZR59_9CYAN|nr:MFS transporter [Aliterella atlantica]KJH69676.1 MFS transporter [Aliterella atlantica CENA595]